MLLWVSSLEASLGNNTGARAAMEPQGEERGLALRYLVIILYASSIPKVRKDVKADVVWSFTSAWGCTAPGSPWSSRVEGANP